MLALAGCCCRKEGKSDKKTWVHTLGSYIRASSSLGAGDGNHLVMQSQKRRGRARPVTEVMHKKGSVWFARGVFEQRSLLLWWPKCVRTESNSGMKYLQDR